MILVTGTSGFIGSVLLDQLIAKFGAANVVALTSKPTDKCNYLLHNDYVFDPDFFMKSGYGKIDTIIHAGAFTPKNGNQANECYKCTSNITNTETLLKANIPNLKRFIFLSTLDVYSICDVLTEESPVIPISLYGQSKVYCEKMIVSWASQNKILPQILRIGHVYGPGEEKYQKAIPVMINKILNNESIQIFGSGEDIRSFIYIEDVINAIIKSIGLELFDGPINIVGGNQISIKNLAQVLIKNAESNTNIEFVETPNTNQRDFIFDNSKMKKYLLNQEIDLVLGLKKEYNYMKNLSE
ncbi:NAD-dependent epimerase/dehydratase family protein [Flavobacterium sp. XS2P12]|uniref:NAD-dependent epimerase/dehydratase family protein n=1 Tax=Flavobacterium melibiosi TaxID=3398734 RepID=UPI003A84BC0A